MAARSRWLTVFLPLLAALTLGVYAAGEAKWRQDLPWAVVQAKLSSSAALIDVGYDDYKAECFPEFIDRPYFSDERSNFGLINQPSGLCLPHLANGYARGNPRPSQITHLNRTYDEYYQDYQTMLQGDMFPPSPAEFDPADPDSFFNDPSNPSLNLPSKVLFPVVASDVIAAVQFADEHGLELSVKNSGHNYAGASSKKDTLHINMNRYTQYAPTGIISCDAESLGTAINEDLSDQPCHLSVAKDKPGVIRVGGGENWDKTYRAVIAANEVQEQEGRGKFHVVGGAIGSVTPMGWTFQGGNSGTTGGSKYGMGVDQVVQIEMVLPNGFHVKFGPTEWEDASAEGFIVPKTTGVTGVCRSNPEEQDEELWIWGECPEDFGIDFMDLWYAVRGGGGGTWGVVLSMHLQLHDYLPSRSYTPNDSEECMSTVFTGDTLMGLINHLLWVEFLATYVIVPSVFNVTEEHSRACGSPGSYSLFCYGEEDVSQAWTTFLAMKNITGGEECLVKTERDGLPVPNPPGHRFEGLLGDGSQSPGLSAFPLSGYIPVPRSWIEKVGVQGAMDIFAKVFADLPSPLFGASGYYSLGSAAVASDQANSLSQAHRDGAVMIQFSDIEAFEIFWSNIAFQLYDMSDDANFPSIIASNHASHSTIGPRKDNWKEPCPTDWTLEERLAGCVSFQEVIYGTKTLKRLEAIKQAVDPNGMFNCHYCILNNGLDGGKGDGETADQGEDATQKDDADPVAVATKDKDDDSGSPRKSVLVVAMMISSAVIWFI